MKAWCYQPDPSIWN